MNTSTSGTASAASDIPPSPVQEAMAALAYARDLAYSVTQLRANSLGDAFAMKEAMAEVTEPDGSLIELAESAAHTRYVVGQAFDNLQALRDAVRTKN